MFNFPTSIPDCDSHSPALLNLFPSMGNSDHVFVSVSTDIPLNSNWEVPFHCIAYDYSFADWDGLCDHLTDIPLGDIFKLGASGASVCHFPESWLLGILAKC